jgi:Domain of unknown function (DUF5615)
VTKISLYMDEDMIAHSLIQALRSCKVDVTSVLEANREGLNDRSQLRWATSEGRIICSANIADFVAS